MAGMGPAPKPDGQRRRRNATAATTRLPAEGWKGKAPAWPLPPDLATATALQSAKDQREMLEAQAGSDNPPDKVHARIATLDQKIAFLTAKLAAAAELEGALWRDLWATPQAAAWERLRWTREVAQYVRWKVAAELGDLDASKEARQLGDRLGLTPLSMLRLRWEIASDEVAAKRAEPRRSSSQRRRRVAAVDPGAVAGA